jgi:glycerophosphoryl diester phosphodiesterase
MYFPLIRLFGLRQQLEIVKAKQMTAHPIIVHHMAAPHSEYPPNSLEAIRNCLESAVQFIEVDVTALGEDDYLLVHDAELQAETTGSGLVGEHTPVQIQQLYLKSPITRTATQFRPTLLSSVVNLFQQYPNQSRLQLDFKNVIPFTDDEPLRRLIGLIEPLDGRIIVSTGADWQLRRLRKLAPWLDLGFDIQFYIDLRKPSETVDPRVPPFKLGAYGYWDDHILATRQIWSTADYLAERCEILTTLVPRISTFYIEHKLIARSLDDGFNWAEALHSYGIKLDAWTVDSDNPVAVANAKRLLTSGTDQFTTNTPNALAAILLQ